MMKNMEHGILLDSIAAPIQPQRPMLTQRGQPIFSLTDRSVGPRFYGP